MATSDQVGAHLGMSGQRVRKMAAQGIIPRRRDLSYNIDSARLAYLAYIRPRLQAYNLSLGPRSGRRVGR